MKKVILLILSFALALFGAACSQTANNDHASMNHNSMDHNSMNHNMPMNSNMPMNHNSMSQMMEMKSDPNAAAAPFDLQFIDTMTHHHEGAVMMAEMVLKKSQNEELKKFAQKIIDDQKKENAQMKQWREKWFSGKPAAKNMEMPGMKDSMKPPVTGDHLKMMEAMTGKDFDLHFLDMMIPHHKGALEMAKDAQAKAEHAELKTLAAEITKEQEAEIKQMTDWKAQWSK
jgi:uncharacterized protein (DUF305 family)